MGKWCQVADSHNPVWIIAQRHQEARKKPRKYEEELFPSTRHAEHTVRRIPVIKERLRE